MGHAVMFPAFAAARWHGGFADGGNGGHKQ
jgi:hypothetical protein